MFKIYIIKTQLNKNGWNHITPKQAQYLSVKVKKKARGLKHYKSENDMRQDIYINKKFRSLNVEAVNLLDRINVNYKLKQHEVSLLKEVFKFLNWGIYTKD